MSTITHENIQKSSDIENRFPHAITHLFYRGLLFCRIKPGRTPDSYALCEQRTAKFNGDNSVSYIIEGNKAIIIDINDLRVTQCADCPLGRKAIS